MANELSTEVMADTAKQITAYARKLLNDDRAKQFAATLSIIAQREQKIKQCSPASIMSAMMACVHLDLMPNTPEQLAYIIPYKTKYGMIAQFQIGYKGMIKLAYRSQDIKNIAAELVFPQDEFDVELGSDRKLIHKPSLEIDRTRFEDAIAVYATAKLANGETVFDVLTKSEFDKVRTNSKAQGEDSPWQTWGESMAKKTAVKRLLKYLPSSTILQSAAEFDSWAEAGKLREVGGEIVPASGKEIAGLDLEPPTQTETPLSVSPELESKLDDALEGVQDGVQDETQVEPEPEPSKPWENDPRFNPEVAQEEDK